jgi:hypothetical protein
MYHKLLSEAHFAEVRRDHCDASVFDGAHDPLCAMVLSVIPFGLRAGGSWREETV